MSTLKELLEEKAKLERQITQVRSGARSEALVQIRALMAQNGLTPADLTGKAVSAPASSPRGKVAAKYGDPESGQTWTGRGLKPKWLVARLAAGRQLDDFAI